MTDPMEQDNQPAEPACGNAEPGPVAQEESAMDASSSPAEDNAKQRILLEALALDPNVQAAAHIAGVSRNTAHRWLRQPAFQEDLARRRDALLVEALGAVKSHATRAAEELGKLLASEDGRFAPTGLQRHPRTGRPSPRSGRIRPPPGRHRETA